METLLGKLEKKMKEEKDKLKGKGEQIGSINIQTEDRS